MIIEEKVGMRKLRLNERQRRLWVVAVFLSRVAALSLPLYFILWVNPFRLISSSF